MMCSRAAALACLSCACLAAQSANQKPAKDALKILPPPTEITSPFDLNAPPSERVNSIEFRPQNAMAASDRTAANVAMPSIAKKSALEGFDLARGNWTYQQIVCPVLPEHLLLLFASNNGPGDQSMFSAIVPRGGNENVLILPILRRGYSPYSVAPANLMTITAFNEARAHENTGKKMDWVTAGLCYAALTGNQVMLSRPAMNPSKDALQFESNPTLEIGDGGITVVSFIDVAAPQQPKAWELTFDKNGKLLTASNSRLLVPTVTLIPQAAVPSSN